MGKSAEAFRSIGELAKLLGVAPHVLRYWETQFTQLKPVKRADGRRYYRPNDVKLAAGLYEVLREEGLSIRGAKKLLAKDRGELLRTRGMQRLGDLFSVDEDVGETPGVIEQMLAAEPVSAPKQPEKPKEPKATKPKNAVDNLPLFPELEPEKTPPAPTPTASPAPKPEAAASSAPTASPAPEPTVAPASIRWDEQLQSLLEELQSRSELPEDALAAAQELYDALKAHAAEDAILAKSTDF